MEHINIHNAKTNLSKLIERTLAGEEIVISRAGKPVAKLVPIDQQSQPRRLGTLRGKIKISADFDARLPDDLISLFEGNAD